MNIGFLLIIAYSRLNAKAERRAGMFAGEVGVYGTCYKCAFDAYYQRLCRVPESFLSGAEYQRIVEDLT